MPSPTDARKVSNRKTPEKTIDLGQKLAKRRSQDFNDKIKGWNETGAGVFSNDGVKAATDNDAAHTPSAKAADAAALPDTLPDMDPAPGEVVADDREDPKSPSSPLDPDSGNKADSKPIAGKKTGRKVDLDRKVWVRRKSSKTQAEITPEAKISATPKKRVVSDGHWRRDRPKEEAVTLEKEKTPTPKPVTVKRSVVSIGLKVPPAVFDVVDPEPEPARARPLRKPRSRSHSRSDHERDATPDYETTGTKVYIKRRRRSRQLDPESSDAKARNTSDSSITEPSSFGKRGSATDLTLPSRSPATDPLDRRFSEPRLQLKHSTSKESATRPNNFKLSPEGKEELRHSIPSRGRPKALLDDGEVLRPSAVAAAYVGRNSEPPKQASGMTAAPAPPVHGSRIEGWLAEMPDPFVDSQTSPASPNHTDNLEQSSKRALDSSNGFGGESQRRKKSDHHRPLRRSIDPPDSGQRPSSAPYEDDDDFIRPSKSTTPSLRRRGARRNSCSPVKGRSSRECTPMADEPLMSGGLGNPSPPSSRQSPDQSPRRSPSGGRQMLSTIASMETVQSRPIAHPVRPHSHGSETLRGAPDGSVLSRASDGDGSPTRRHESGLKRRLTKHSDLISVLSLPRDDMNTVISARSVRTRRADPEHATVGDLMNEISSDELKYQRELRTLVDGVIPVLLQYALSGSDSPDTQIFNKAMRGPAGTAPIVDMGVALERLKAAHRRIPLHEPNDLVNWADTNSRLYTDYLKTWRLGFKDVVVNLAPADAIVKRDESSGWDHDLPRNRHGDLLGGDGERVDVAYLLKRPLVRLKYLARILKALNQLQPSSKAESVAAAYANLVADAKTRAGDEKARLEDEAAAGIDPARARDPRTLGPISGVVIDPTRSVRARDYFDMDLMHSSGQQLGCKIEVIYRDDAPDRGTGGDVLFCEISTSDRWLLFPPLPHALVSARKGDRSGELIVMIRGFNADARQWREVMSLRADGDQTSADWTQMLGSSPMPPRLSKRSSFNMLEDVKLIGSSTKGADSGTHGTPEKSRELLLRELEVPIGETAKSTSRIWDGSEVNSVSNEPSSPRMRTVQAPISRPSPYHSQSDARPQYYYERQDHQNSSPTGNRTKTSHERSKSDWSEIHSRKDYNVWLPSSDRTSDESSADEDDSPTARPGMHRRTSSVPALDMPTISKLWKSVQPESSQPHSDRSQARGGAVHDSTKPPTTAPAKTRPSRSKESTEDDEQKLPSTQPQARPTQIGLRSGALPSFTPAFLKRDRRSSSPLKHEYEPSTASDSMSDSGVSDADEIESITSESTVDDAEVVSTLGDLKAFQQYARRPLSQPVPSHRGDYSTGGSLTPSESASQAPYRTVPSTATAPSKTVACIFTWSDRGSWDSLHPEECSIYVTPGLIEAFDLTQAHSVSQTDNDGTETTPTSKGVKPLVALELTPLVPLRRGTAVDISIRSPPTSSSLIRTGSNIMFRSRSPEECEKLYAMINRARIDNPTYIALQNARGPAQQSNWAEVMDRRPALRSTSASWWQLGSRKSSSYRSTGSRPASIAATESSVGTMNSAFSALRRFSGGSRIWNIAKSTITSRDGTRSTNSESLSSDAAAAAAPVALDPALGTPLGLTNAKVRLYLRESASKWRDLGHARLMVVLPPRQDPMVAANPAVTGLEKRILVYGKSKGETLLDVTLGESCFERIARTGIAVSVWEEVTGPNGEIGQVGAVGGVLNSRARVYMIQMKSERDAAYTFGLVGKLRY